MQWRFWQWKKREADFEEEIAHDLAADTEERVRLGVPREEAEWASRRDFGNAVLLKEDVREVWGWSTTQRVYQDGCYGLRILRKNPLFTSMAILSLALGIGANTAIYSAMDAVMMRALPVRNPKELVILNWHARTTKNPAVVRDFDGSTYEDGGGKTSPNLPWPVYELFRDHSNLFTSLFAYEKAGELNLIVHRRAAMGNVQFVSGNFFSGLGVVPALGRLISESDDRPNAAQVAVLSYDCWQSRFNGDPAVIGQTIRIKNIPFIVTGVAAPEFFGVSPGFAPAVYVSIANRPALTRNYGNERDAIFIDPHAYWVSIMGRLRPGVTLAQAQVELAAGFHRFVLDSAKTKEERANLPALWLEDGGNGMDSLRRQYSKPLFILMAMVALILLIACANIANLLLARANARRREIAVRLSLGASRWRVLRQLLTESVLLAIPGGLLGLGVAALGVRFLNGLVTGGRNDFDLPMEIDGHILAFTMVVAVATGILFGLAPAIQATRVDVTPALKETRASAPRRHRRRIGLSQMLMIAQVAFSLLLVLGAAIFVRTLANLHAVNLGFNQEKILLFDLDASQAGYKDGRLRVFYASMTERFRTLPGVRHAALSDLALVANGMHGTRVILPGAPKQQGDSQTDYISVGPEFFETMQLPMVLGRSIDKRDVAGGPLAVVVNEVFAKKYFPNQNPIGRHFQLGNGRNKNLSMTIVGVAKNARYDSLKQEIPPVAYIAYFQDALNHPPPPMVFELRTVGNPLALAEAVRKVVHQAAPNVPVTEMMTQRQRIDSTIAQERTFADLCSVFAVLALLIASVGLYGTMAYAVSQRTNEIGIRMALGAKRRRILWMVLREVLVMAVAGIVIGLVCARSATFTIQSFVFGMKAADPVTMLTAAVILIVALIVAGLGPATRAAGIDPVTALRHE